MFYMYVFAVMPYGNKVIVLWRSDDGGGLFTMHICVAIFHKLHRFMIHVM